MILGLILAAMTAAAVVAVIWPLARRAGAAPSGSDMAVYRDQLAEIERDRAAGLVGKTEAEAARVEISRRLLAASDAAQAALPAGNAVSAAWRRRAVAAASLLALPIVAGSLYLFLGSPELASGQPVAQHNVAATPQSIEGLVAEAEAHLARNAQDGRGWEILAPIYMRLGRYADSVAAWRNTLQLLGDSAEREANLGEALTAEANDVVTADAKTAFIRAVTLDKTNVTARYYLGLAAEQDGQRDKAANIWRDLIAEAPAGTPWVIDVRNALARVESTSAAAPAPAAVPAAPAAEKVADADSPPSDQNAAIRGMVDRLAARLKQDGSDLNGWVQLVRSYKVLGEPDKARAAAADARQAFAGEPEKLQQLNAALQQLEDNAAAPPAPSPHGTAPAAAGAAPDHPQGMSMEDMVARLAERLKSSGSNPEGWLMLVRSYETMGEKAKAKAAIGDARHALADDPGKLEAFNSALKHFNIGE
jgi:cytochrome c-type biogenesis protein CcmH